MDEVLVTYSNVDHDVVDEVLVTYGNVDHDVWTRYWLLTVMWIMICGRSIGYLQ